MPHTARSRKVTLKDIAQEADVSIAAVSKALSDHPQISDETKQRVRQISQRMKYEPRRSPNRVTRAYRLALLVVGSDSAPPYLIPLINNVNALSDENQTLSLEVTAIADADDPANGDLLSQLAANVDGIMLDGAVTETLFRRVSALPVASVVLGNVGGDPLQQYDVGCIVTADIRAMGCTAARRLLDSGRRNIAFICSHVRSNFWFDQWLQGYRHAHVEAGVPIDPELAIITGSGGAGIHAAGMILASSSPPDGYVIPDSTTASQFVTHMALNGKPIQPHDLIYGASYGDPEKHVLAPFRSVHVDMVRLSQTALNTLRLVVARQTKPPMKIIVPFREVPGDSG